MPDPVDLGLPRSARVRHKRDFAAVFASRRTAASGPLVVHGVYTDGPRMRLGLAVGRKIGHAPTRNRIKRLLREAWRTARHAWPGGWDIVVVVKPHDPLLTLEACAEHLDNAVRALTGGDA